jgi:hypothetical protein
MVAMALEAAERQKPAATRIQPPADVACPRSASHICRPKAKADLRSM